MEIIDTNPYYEEFEFLVRQFYRQIQQDGIEPALFYMEDEEDFPCSENENTVFVLDDDKIVGLAVYQIIKQQDRTRLNDFLNEFFWYTSKKEKKPKQVDFMQHPGFRTYSGEGTMLNLSGIESFGGVGRPILDHLKSTPGIELMFLESYKKRQEFYLGNGCINTEIRSVDEGDPIMVWKTDGKY